MAEGVMYTVKEGDTLPSVAVAEGYRSWETIWYHDRNASLKDLRQNPGVLNPGDQLFLPEKEPKDFNCETNKRNTFRIKALKAFLELVLEDVHGQPFANAAYKAVIDGAVTIEGTTDGDGYFKKPIPPTSKKAKLTVTPADGRPPLEYALTLGFMDPLETNTGVQAILNNLGYDAGANDGTIDDQFRAALIGFQMDNNLEPTGEIDEATRAALAT